MIARFLVAVCAFSVAGCLASLDGSSSVPDGGSDGPSSADFAPQRQPSDLAMVTNCDAHDPTGLQSYCGAIRAGASCFCNDGVPCAYCDCAVLFHVGCRYVPDGGSHCDNFPAFVCGP